MKKAILTLAAIGVVGGATAGWFLWTQSGGHTLSAAQLLPAETLVLAEFPDFKGSGARWQETSLAKIIREPEVQAFLERPKSRIPAEFINAKKNFRQAEPQSAFIALAGLEDNMPKAVAGVTFNGPRTEIESLVAQAKARAQKASPGGKANLEKYKAFEIESFSDNDVTLAGAFAGNWYFLANDLSLLKATLDRFSGEVKEGALANAEVYTKTVSQVSPDPELRVFGRVDALVERFGAFAALSGKPVDEAQMAEIRKAKAFAATTRFDGERIRDTFFLLSPGAAPAPALSGATLALTSPETLFYYAFSPVLPDKLEIPQQVADPSGVLSALRMISDQLGQQGVGAAEFKAALGPEFSILTDWPRGALSPSVALVAEIRDATLARKIVEAICAEWKKEEGEGVTYWTQSEGATIALSEKAAIVGQNPTTVKAIAMRTQSGADSLGKTAAFETSLATVSKPGSALGYVNAKAIFEQVYGTMRPSVMFAGAMIPQVAAVVDVAKLPTTEPISKHLLPSVFSSSQTADGYLAETTGTVTFNQGGALIGAAGAVAIYQAMQGKLPVPGLGTPPVPPLPKAQPTPAPAPEPAISTSAEMPASENPASSD